MTPEQRVEWEREVRSLYHDGMVRIVATPNWAKLVDFETTLPSAAEELIRQREERQARLSGAWSLASGGLPTPQPHREAERGLRGLRSGELMPSTELRRRGLPPLCLQ